MIERLERRILELAQEQFTAKSVEHECLVFLMLNRATIKVTS